MDIRQIQDAENFISNYEEVKNSLENIDVYGEMKQYIKDTLEDFIDNYKVEYENAQDILKQEENEELDYMNMDFERSRI